MHNFSGKWIIVDGLDGIGKGVITSSIIDFLKEDYKKSIFNLIDYLKSNGGVYPDYSLAKDFDVILSCEPTHSIAGSRIRDVVIANGSDASPLDTATAYSDDRLEHYNKLIFPALADGKIVVQDRSVCSSIVYQSSMGNLSMNEIMELEGNKLALDNAPNLIIIPTIKDPKDLIDRINFREKDDNCLFENIDFQLKLKPLYESRELKEIFSSRGTEVKYLDAGVSIDYTISQSKFIIKNFL